ncbi:MAG: hypothetical protein KDA27_00670 [Candidatus Eisenbacteria bacterium]|uniref:Uncharacterized protein n=1 Tax=Eiseniibacteriota bacterium TaxID=2212470 RepID=A0A956N7X5_UNCEI|nr:hypothetical protein [Candidatus Eisenbacteria bacterium]
MHSTRVLWVLGPVLLLLAGPSRAEWTLSGEAGVQLDSIGEEFGSGAQIDEQIDPTDPLDDVAADIRFRDRSTESTALLSLRVRESTRILDGSLRLKSRPEKSRAEFDLRGEIVPGPGMWRWQDRLYTEFAGTEADGGWIHLAGLSWSTRDARVRSTQGGWFDRHGAGASFGLSHELSRAGEDSLASLFDYALLRPRAELFGQFAGAALALEGGTQRKRIVDDGDGSYDGSFLELRGTRGRLSIVARTESRHYEHADSLSPSYQDASGRVDWSRPLGWRDEVRVEGTVRALQYAHDSSVFRDHLEWSAALAWRRELGTDGRVSSAAASSSRSATSGSASSDRTSAGANESSPDLLGALRDLDEALAELEALEVTFEADSTVTFPDSTTVETEHRGNPDAPGDANGTDAPESSEGEGRLVSASGGEVDDAFFRSFRASGRWYTEIGAFGSGSVGETSDLGDYTEVGGRASAGRQGGERLWLDLSLGLGRRDYLRAGSATDLVFEGFDFSLSGSDYTFLELSALGEVSLPGALSLELFGQYEDQWHDESADDFRLWILTVSLTRKF